MGGLDTQQIEGFLGFIVGLTQVRANMSRLSKLDDKFVSNLKLKLEWFAYRETYLGDDTTP